MATNTRFPRRSAYRLAIICGILLAAGAGGTALAMQPAAGQAGVDMGTLSIGGANATTTGGVSDVRLQTSVAWEYDVPDAERRIVELRAGPDAQSLETLSFDQSEVSAGQDSGTVSFDVSLLDAGGFDATMFEPPLAGSASQEVVVEARIEVRRAGGDAVVETVTDTATVTVHDGETLSAGVGGTGDITVE